MEHSWRKFIPEFTAGFGGVTNIEGYWRHEDKKLFVKITGVTGAVSSGNGYVFGKIDGFNYTLFLCEKVNEIYQSLEPFIIEDEFESLY